MMIFSLRVMSFSFNFFFNFLQEAYLKGESANLVPGFMSDAVVLSMHWDGEQKDCAF